MTTHTTRTTAQTETAVARAEDALPRPFSSVLVANRGEIARRVFRSARALGLSCVAVHSDADAQAPHVAEADAAVPLPGTAPGETYLRGERIVEAARLAGADAVHPGYGFLSENAGFARAVLDAGLAWIGPPPEAIAAMGSKIEAKRLMARAGVPVLAETDPGAVAEADLPVLIKASAGGGGRGMRIVTDLAALPGELAAARAEAEAAFGDPAVFCEPYLAAGRHIEVQVLADAHGTVWAVGERECSIQRRHQKVLEEAPSPLVERRPGMREELFEAAREAARAIGYRGAGTVEFLADEATGRFFFLEMNTRLQVEHPVTECTTGLDLVAWQLRIARGAALPPQPPPSRGHAIEVRLYAEDPGAGWRPQPGTFHRVRVPGVAAEFAVPEGGGLRLDAGVTDGSEVTVHYDPMLAKVIAWAPERSEAAAALAAALARAELHGPPTNRDLLVNVLRHPAFLVGDTDTGFLERYAADGLADPLASPVAVRLSALAAALADAAHRRADARALGTLPSGWRNVPSRPQRAAYLARGGEEVAVGYRLDRSGALAVAEGFEDLAGLEPVEAAPGRVVLAVGGVRRAFSVARYGEGGREVHVDSPLGPVALTAVPRFAGPAEAAAAPGALLAPMPGTVTALAEGVAAGVAVAAGQPLLWLEAMKMQHRIEAPHDGVLAELAVGVGERVEVGALLGVVRPGKPDEERPDGERPGDDKSDSGKSGNEQEETS
ncbi:biotin carboxylase N-terminal domain-containing protein [Streptomyces sp. DSM 44917]|uniref:Biotin carboxylase N-terminal domain-containing protein n=1 Tax=Streptomyces boetiae TaxID=3075541 RepID=A0ABU2L440_9ACTN|nr:biotin carboxylase N-terminal domain-containing protein [Streptomyces sp. DSM 44917]MDT0306282.1 biotin carboxylase N-terminal domain-containing protein [Streptomyces sp. DSM 44917]